MSWDLNTLYYIIYYIIYKYLLLYFKDPLPKSKDPVL